jgi:hypothetical protein
MQLTLLSEEPPAKPSASPDCAKDWQTRVATSRLPSLPLLHDIAPAGWFGRTSPASCQMKQGRLVPCSEGWQNSGMGSPTGFLTLSTTEWPKDAAVCSLSDILEDAGSVPPQFYLSAKACAGILRRAARQRVAQPLANGSGERGWKISADNAATHLMPVGFTCKDHGADVGENIAPTLRAMGHTGSSPNGGGQVAIACFDERQVTSKTHRGQCSGDVTGTLNSGAGMTVAHSLRAEGHDASEDGTGRGTPLVPELARCVATREGMSLDWETTTILPAQMAVRRLTPRECERLQGFPDDYTKIPYRGKPSEQCPDGPRYKALGNSMAVPVMRWIAHSITQIDHL